MIRIDMINLISNWLLENAPDTYEKQSSYGRRIDAEGLLDLIEEHGMLPPDVSRNLDGTHDEEKRKVHQDYKKSVHYWEGDPDERSLTTG